MNTSPPPPDNSSPLESTHHSFLERLIHLGEKAGALIKEIYHKPDIRVQYKEDGSPFTIADVECDLLIQKELQQLTPHLPIVSEEQPPPSLKHQDDSFWIVDPLDGTKGFLQKSGEFVVNIALIEKRRPVLGLIHIPLTAETYVAFQNQAYYKKRGELTSLQPLLPPSEKWDVVIGHSLSKEKDGVWKMKKRFPLGSIRKVGSALKFCSFATGEAHFSWRLSPCCEWDTAAADALVEALGGCFKTFDGKPLLYAKPAYLNTDGFLVYGSKEMQYFSPHA